MHIYGFILKALWYLVISETLIQSFTLHWTTYKPQEFLTLLTLKATVFHLASLFSITWHKRDFQHDTWKDMDTAPVTCECIKGI